MKKNSFSEHYLRRVKIILGVTFVFAIACYIIVDNIPKNYIRALFNP